MYSEQKQNTNNDDTTDQSAFSILSIELHRIDLFGNRVVQLLKTCATCHVTLVTYALVQ